MAHDALRSQLQGELLESGSQAYDIARTVWNGMIDRRPGDLSALLRHLGQNDLHLAACVDEDAAIQLCRIDVVV